MEKDRIEFLRREEVRKAKQKEIKKMQDSDPSYIKPFKNQEEGELWLQEKLKEI